MQLHLESQSSILRLLTEDIESLPTLQVEFANLPEELSNFIDRAQLLELLHNYSKMLEVQLRIEKTRTNFIGGAAYSASAPAERSGDRIAQGNDLPRSGQGGHDEVRRDRSGSACYSRPLPKQRNAKGRA